MKRCKHCNNRVVKDYDGDVHCAECGREDWYDTEGVTRDKINAYLRKNGWECAYSERLMMPMHTAEKWSKKGYDFTLVFQWLCRTDYPGAMMVEEEQIWRAINHVADSEGIGYAEAAERMAK